MVSFFANFQILAKNHGRVFTEIDVIFCGPFTPQRKVLHMKLQFASFCSSCPFRKFQKSWGGGKHLVGGGGFQPPPLYETLLVTGFD